MGEVPAVLYHHDETLLIPIGSDVYEIISKQDDQLFAHVFKLYLGVANYHTSTIIIYIKKYYLNSMDKSWDKNILWNHMKLENNRNFMLSKGIVRSKTLLCGG